MTSAILISSCASEARLTRAAETAGRAEAGLMVPDWPDDCRRQEAHAAARLGDEPVSVLKRERAALDRQNARTARCAGFHDDFRERVMR